MSDRSDTSEHSAENPKDSRRRPRRSYNCGPCKRQKIKCDTDIPCGACRRHNRVEQCLASPPNPPSPDHRKRVRKQSLSAFGAPEQVHEFRAELQQHQQRQHQLNHHHHQAVHLHHPQNPTSQLPPSSNASSYPKIDPPVKLPSIHTYTTTFKVSDKFPHSYTQISGSGSNENLVGLGSTQTSSSSNKPWDQSRQYHLPPALESSPPTRDLEMSQLKSQLAVLTDRLAQLEAKVSTHSSAEPTPVLPSRHLRRQDNVSSVRQYNENLGSLPERRILATVVSFFKKYLNKPLEILDEKVIDSRLAAFKLKEEGDHTTQEDWENISLISIIMSLTVLYYPKDKSAQDLNVKPDSVVQVANHLLQLSKNALSMVKYKEHPRLIHLQVLLLYDISLRLFNKKNLIMAMGSELVSMAYMLGLQTHKIPQNSLEIDVSQKVWWIICHNDTLNSLKFGTPPLIRLESLPKDQIGNSQILKAFISAELNTSYQALLTHIAKLTKICNEVPPSIGSSLVEYLENLIMVDRQLTTYQVPQSLSILNPRNDITTNFQCCYLQFFIILNRFRIYRKIYFSNPDDGIWFVMLSVVESFLKRYTELRELYPPEEYTDHYLQLSNCIVVGSIVALVMITSEPEKLPRGLKEILVQYTKTIIGDMTQFRRTIFNENVPFFQRAFETTDKLMTRYDVGDEDKSEEMMKKQQWLSMQLQKSRVFESHESCVGLVPSNDFFNVYFGNIAHHSRNVTIANHTWKLDGVLGIEQLEFLSCIGA